MTWKENLTDIVGEVCVNASQPDSNLECYAHLASASNTKDNRVIHQDDIIHFHFICISFIAIGCTLWATDNVGTSTGK